MIKRPQGRVFITGDVHYPKHFKHIRRFPRWCKDLTKNDVLIVCGDLGIIWSYDPDQNQEGINKFQELPCTVCFVDGNHENHLVLNNLPKINKFSSKVRKISDSVFYLIRGNVYKINGKKIFAYGGGHSYDKHRRLENINWWPNEIPGINDQMNAIKNLAIHDWKVDYIVTHTPSEKDIKTINSKEDFYFSNFQDNPETNHRKFLDTIKSQLNFRKHYCGHLHIEYKIPQTRVIYKQTLELK